jgi:hypothetical protein
VFVCQVALNVSYCAAGANEEGSTLNAFHCERFGYSYAILRSIHVIVYTRAAIFIPVSEI